MLTREQATPSRRRRHLVAGARCLFSQRVRRSWRCFFWTQAAQAVLQRAAGWKKPCPCWEDGLNAGRRADRQRRSSGGREHPDGGGSPELPAMLSSLPSVHTTLSTTAEEPETASLWKDATSSRNVTDWLAVEPPKEAAAATAATAGAVVLQCRCLHICIPCPCSNGEDRRKGSCTMGCGMDS